MSNESDSLVDESPGSPAERKRGLHQRQCLICRHRAEKREMLRLVVDDAGEVWPDLFQKAPGRGSYLCMESACLEQLTDKRLGALRRNFEVKLPQCDRLMQRLIEALEQQLRRLFSQHRAVVVLGRDAVMHQMWKSGPLLVLLASDGGDALLRQVTDAVAKRADSGSETLLMQRFSSLFLADVVGREKVSVAAVDISAVSAKLYPFCVWYERLADRAH